MVLPSIASRRRPRREVDRHPGRTSSTSDSFPKTLPGCSRLPRVARSAVLVPDAAPDRTVLGVRQHLPPRGMSCADHGNAMGKVVHGPTRLSGPDGARRAQRGNSPIASGPASGQSSSSTVNGPSLTLVTAIVAPKTPVLTSAPRRRSSLVDLVDQRLGDRSGCGGRPATAGVPCAVLAVQRELAHHQDRGAAWRRADCSSRRMRSPCSLPASALAVAARVGVGDADQREQTGPEPIAPTRRRRRSPRPTAPGTPPPSSPSHIASGRVQQAAGDRHPDRRQHRGGQRARVEVVGGGEQVDQHAQRQLPRCSRPAGPGPTRRPAAWRPGRPVGAASAAPGVQPSWPASDRSSRITDGDSASRVAEQVGVGRRRRPSGAGPGRRPPPAR